MPSGPRWPVAVGSCPFTQVGLSGTISWGCPTPPISCPAPEALNGSPLLSLPSWLCSHSRAGGSFRACSQELNPACMGSRTHQQQLLCPPTAARRGAASQTCPQSHSTKRPRSPGGHPASLLCNHMASRGGVAILSFPHVASKNSATEVILFRPPSPALDTNNPTPFCLAWQS